MAKQLINLGVQANDGTGDSLRTGAFKINQNFDELYAAIGTGINGILSGEGIAVVNSFGQVTITNTQPNRGSFNTIEVAGQSDVTTEELSDTLTFVAGQNVTLTTNASQKTVTISVDSIELGDLSGAFTGTFDGTVTGTLSGTFDGIVTSNNLDTSLLKVSGNAAQALIYYQDLQDQRNTLLSDIVILENQLQSLQSDLNDAQSSLAYWQSQPESSEKTQAINLLNNQILTIESQIIGVGTQISVKNSQVAELNISLDELEPTLSVPYVSITYDTTLLQVESDRKLSVPELNVSSLGCDIFYNAREGLSESNSQFSVSPTGVLLSVNDATVNIYGNRIAYDNRSVQSYPQTATVAANTSGVIFTEAGSSSQTMKLLVLAESDQEVQSSEIMVAKSGSSNVICTVYGIVYTGTGPICNFNAQWNSITSKIEITATNLSLTDPVNFVVQSLELSLA